VLAIFSICLLVAHGQYTPKKIVIEAEEGDWAGKHKRGTQTTKCGSRVIARNSPSGYQCYGYL
jgi:hypothetical protein